MKLKNIIGLLVMISAIFSACYFLEEVPFDCWINSACFFVSVLFGFIGFFKFVS